MRPIVKVALVGIVAILAIVYMASLSHRMPLQQTRAGMAYTLPEPNSLETDEPLDALMDDSSSQLSLEEIEEQQALLAQAVREQDLQRKAELLKSLSKFE